MARDPQVEINMRDKETNQEKGERKKVRYTTVGIYLLQYTSGIYLVCATKVFRLKMKKEHEKNRQ